jgi:hypothetical protein
MQPVWCDANLGELVQLDIVDVRLDGSYVLNEEFVQAARAAYEADPSCFDSVFCDLILARAVARGVALFDVEGLALTALEVDANAAQARADA